jgi:catechol 2,3-dioxygenase-like lactoylglutathione lyase family enzyme
MKVYGPIPLRTLSKSGIILQKVANAPGLIQKFIESTSPHIIRNQYTTIALLSSSGKTYDLVLVEERHPKTNMTKSVEGNTLFGFSCLLSSSVNGEVLAWDLHEAEVDFMWGDPGMDGMVYTKEHSHHSLYISDPDGRIIELIQDGCKDPSCSFIAGINTISLHCTSPDASLRFYLDKLNMHVESDTGSSIPGKRLVWLSTAHGNRCILLYGQTKPDGNPLPAGGFGLDHFALTGCTSIGEKNTDALNLSMDPEHLATQPSSRYIKDADGYWIECMQV